MSDYEKYKAALDKQVRSRVSFPKRFASKPRHSITLGWGPASSGGWPFAICACGWTAISKDVDVVVESITEHSEQFYTGQLGGAS